MASTEPKDKTVEVQAQGEVEGEITKTKTAQRKLDLEEQPKKWTNFFDSNRLSANGVSLNYVAPVMKNGEKIIELNKEEIEKATEEWKQALILYVVGDSSTIAVIERCIALHINTVSKPKVFFTTMMDTSWCGLQTWMIEMNYCIPGRICFTIS
ncbi:putative protein DOWNSTREAM OF FLC-like [Capsicum annuum]|uniref:Uncharacterized protein n=1 Tax=Capsicum annuum TaxID=4072 RepID=A0A2G2ZJ84_CAPAN|nr:putative protein DOWNSTREAM OF FLC-like [Capsicum annuum]KAF3656813.1 putative protein DOWNSTREAM OF FLC-like [Capsicum annuum]PHT82058.1 hypothetical protein T459_15073 [Capsicum annuum]